MCKHHISLCKWPTVGLQRTRWIMLSTVVTLVTMVSLVSSHYTNEFAIQLNLPEEHGLSDESMDWMAEDIAKKHGFELFGRIGSLEGYYLLVHNDVAKRSLDHAEEHHEKLTKEAKVSWFEQQKILKRKKRDNSKTVYRYKDDISDPLFTDQWYLEKGASGGYDMNVQGAWKLGYTGTGVVVTILDDGIQATHPDLQLNYDAQASFDINDNDADPTPQDNGDNKHGTRCAGEVAAQAYNDVCGVGIAFNASIGGVRMLDGPVTDQVEARALSLNPHHIDIYSASWGPEDDGKTVDGPGMLAKRAFMDGIKKGRNGLGSIYVWASGNGGRKQDNCNCDGYTNSIYTLSISSATQTGSKPWYLEECSSTLATTYSSGTPSRDPNIVTVDLDTSYFRSLTLGRKPDLSSLCTRTHTGTSASAPIAAGMCALALEANPQLTWRSMQHLVVLTSRYEPLRQEAGWRTNALGRHYSHKFGYGLMDGEALVRYAEKWTPLPEQRICETEVHEVKLEISGDPSKETVTTIDADGCANKATASLNYLEHVQARVTLKFMPRGNVKITLISPSGTVSDLLFPRPRDQDETTFNRWPFLSVHFWNEPVRGVWTLKVKNDGQSTPTSGNLHDWSLIFYGTSEFPTYPSLNQTKYRRMDVTKLEESAIINNNKLNSRLIPQHSEKKPDSHMILPNTFKSLPILNGLANIVIIITVLSLTLFFLVITVSHYRSSSKRRGNNRANKEHNYMYLNTQDVEYYADDDDDRTVVLNADDDDDDTLYQRT